MGAAQQIEALRMALNSASCQQVAAAAKPGKRKQIVRSQLPHCMRCFSIPCRSMFNDDDWRR